MSQFVKKVRSSFKAAREDMTMFKNSMTEWIKHFSTKQIIAEERVAQLEKRIELLERKLVLENKN